MRKFFWLISGISIGFAVAKQIQTNPAAKAIADDVERAAREFGNAVVEGFRERETELAEEKPATKRTVKPAAK